MPIHVVTGLGPDGRSKVVSKAEKVLGAPRAAGLLTDDSSIRASNDGAAMQIANLYQTGPAPQVERPARGVTLPIPTPPGGVMWLELKFDGGTVQELHRTDSIDLQHILSGEVELVLEEGAVRLSAGDTVVIPGVVHGWRSETGWSSGIFILGLAPV